MQLSTLELRFFLSVFGGIGLSVTWRGGSGGMRFGLGGFNVLAMVVLRVRFIGSIYKVKQKEYQENGLDSMIQLKKLRFWF